MAGLLLGEDVSERLKGFSKAHVIGENPVQAMAGEELHPVESGELIVAQRGPQAAGGRHGIDAGKVLELACEFLEVRRGVDAQPAEAGEGSGVERVEPRLVGEFRVDQRGEVIEDFPHAADGQLERVAVRQRRVDVAIIGAVEGFLEEIALQQAGENRQQVVALAADLEADREAEPAAIAGVERAVPLRRIRLVDAVADIIGNGDRPAEAL